MPVHVPQVDEDHADGQTHSPPVGVQRQSAPSHAEVFGAGAVSGSAAAGIATLAAAGTAAAGAVSTPMGSSVVTEGAPA